MLLYGNDQMVCCTNYHYIVPFTRPIQFVFFRKIIDEYKETKQLVSKQKVIIGQVLIYFGKEKQEGFHRLS
jgi:hypothetical protein